MSAASFASAYQFPPADRQIPLGIVGGGGGFIGSVHAIGIVTRTLTVGIKVPSPPWRRVPWPDR
jgi:hypothetical protein